MFSPHCSYLCTTTTAHLKTPPSSSWSLQTTTHWLASSSTVTSLLTDRRLRSWLSGAVLTTWSLTRSKLWRWLWTSGETPLLPPPPPPTLTIMNSTVESFKFLDNQKKDNQRLYFLRQLRKFNLPQELLKTFYSAIIESVLCTSMTVWFGSATKANPFLVDLINLGSWLWQAFLRFVCSTA